MTLPTPQVRPWYDTLDVSVDSDIAVQVHVGFVLGFIPTPDTYRMMLYGPGTVRIGNLPTEVDLYVRLGSLDGEDVSESPLPVQLTAAT